MAAVFARSSADISSGFGGTTLKIRTNAPSLVTISPVRSIASTASSSPASGSSRSPFTALTAPFAFIISSSHR